MDTSTKIGNVHLDNCVMNASCHPVNFKMILEAHSGAVVHKTLTLMENPGNPHPRYYSQSGMAINAVGLSNQGIRSIKTVPGNIPVIYSIGGKNEMEIIEAFQRSRADIVEINVSCPNISGKDVIGYDLQSFAILLKRIFRSTNRTVGIKLPPYFSRSQIRSVAKLILKYPEIGYIVCSNTVPNGLMVNGETETTRIIANNGYGGISGQLVKPIALSNVRQFWELLNGKVSIIGCGGICTGMDVFEYILCGADAVQVGTTFIDEGPECIKRITDEFKGVCESKGYKKIKDFQGKLKIYSKL